MKKTKIAVLVVAILGISSLIYLIIPSISADTVSPSYSNNILPVLAKQTGKSAIQFNNGLFEFTFTKDNQTIKYIFDPEDSENKAGYLNLKVKSQTNEFFAIKKATPIFRIDDKNTLVRLGNASVSSSLVSTDLNSNSLILTYRDKFINQAEQKRKTVLALEGGSLKLAIDSSSVLPEEPYKYNYAGFDLGSPEGQSLRKIRIPYAPYAPVNISSNVFSTAFLDPTRSNATGFDSVDINRATYPLRYALISADNVSKLREVAYVSASLNIDHVLPAPDNPRVIGSNQIKRMFLLENTLPNRAVPGERNDEPGENEDRSAFCQTSAPVPTQDNKAAELPIPLEGQSFNQYVFHNTSVYLNVLAELGIKDIVYGSLKFAGKPTPRHLPPCQRWGGSQQYAKIFQTAQRNGQIHIDHQVFSRINGNYFTEGSPDYDQLYYDATVKTINNKPRVYAGESGSYASADYLIKIAQPVVETLTSEFGLSGTFQDALPGWIPDRLNKLSFAPNSRTNTLAKAIKYMKEYFIFLNQKLSGPVMGEGGKGPERYDGFYSGYIDGVERENDGQKNGLVIPDYEIKVVEPKSPLQVGMGWQNRWQCQSGQGAQDNPESGGAQVTNELCNAGMSKFNLFDFDRYRAQTISFGHTHLLPMSMNYSPKDADKFQMLIKQITKEYYLMNALQKQYLYQKIQSIVYFDNAGAKIGDLSTVLINRPDYNFNSSNIELTYQNGLVIYINNAQSSSEENWSLRVDNKDFIIQPNGFVAYNPNQKGWQGKGNFIAFSALVDSKRLDYVSSPAYLFMDSLNQSASYNGDTTDQLRAILSDREVICDNSVRCHVKRSLTAIEPGLNLVGNLSSQAKISDLQANKVFGFNLSGNLQDWTTYPEDNFNFIPSNAYYVLNSTNTTKKINLPFANGLQPPTLKPGWNLFWNQSQSDISQIRTKVGLNDTSCKFKDIQISELKDKKLIAKEIFIIENPKATTACEAFKLLSDTQTASACTSDPTGYAKTNSIKAQTGYWVYLWKESIDKMQSDQDFVSKKCS